MAQLNLPPSHARPTSSASHTPSHYNLASPSSPLPPEFHDSDDDASSLSSDSSPLPFPAALARADFLTPSFDAATYLSDLHTGGPASRHQTLEDLRAELRDRSAAVSAELLELVNANYAAFLGLGGELQGGEERVGDVRVALLGFRRAVEEIRGRVAERRGKVGVLNGELEGVRGAVEVGRRMLELEERVGALEGRLEVASVGAGKKGREVDGVEEEDDWEAEGDSDLEDSEVDEEDEEEGDVEFVSTSPGKLAALARKYVVVEQIAKSIGRDLPFVRKMEERMARCRNTILLDLSTTLREARKAGVRGQGRVIKVMAIYRILDAQADAVKVLKEK
ncbi:oligomeric golgi complex component, COG2-domain-containing protein [Staphylotrichum tortipilum]|uniref:Conserved oligomeric Golgi complex subunit 2 n=1 Tax=Staphylotrichum tortipilum TaxID=2831512 RepID=A0AAN6RSK1_9PEZI|nr:oligomeric golgi complex component, COG2-domain-containing protein [Staphylotrichum longicolle]